MAIEAGRLMLKRIGELLQKNESFSIETTLSTRSYYKLAISICQSWIRGYWSTIVKLRGQLLLREDKSKKQKYETTSYINLLKNMSNAEHRQMIEKIAYGLEVAEREMLEEKARNNEDVIVCGDDNIIRHIPAKYFL